MSAYAVFHGFYVIFNLRKFIIQSINYLVSLMFPELKYMNACKNRMHDLYISTRTSILPCLPFSSTVINAFLYDEARMRDSYAGYSQELT